MITDKLIGPKCMHFVLDKSVQYWILPRRQQQPFYGPLDLYH